MWKRYVMAAFLAAVAGSAAAQTPAPGDANADRGGRVEMGLAGPMMRGEMATGFILDLGDERSLRVFCGDEPIGTCMEAVRPLIDQVPSLMSN